MITVYFRLNNLTIGLNFIPIIISVVSLLTVQYGCVIFSRKTLNKRWTISDPVEFYYVGDKGNNVRIQFHRNVNI